MKKYNIIVKGGYGLTNFGDDALLKSIHNDYLTRYSTKELAYSSKQSEYIKKDINNFDSIPVKLDYNGLTKVLIYGGGTQFYSFYKKKNIIQKITTNLHLIFEPKKLKEKINSFLLRNRSKSLISEKPTHSTIALGIGVGPFLEEADPHIEQQTKILFQQMDFVAVRDVFSLQKCKEWGVKNYRLYADLCFKMDHDKFLIKASKENVEKIGVIVRDWDKTIEGDSYRENLFKVSSDLKQKGHEVYFVIFAKDRDQNWLKLLKKKKEKLIMWNPESSTIDSFFEILSTFDLFITARYHGAVFSALLGKPFITIEIEQKLAMINKIFFNGSYNWSYPFDSCDLVDKFNKINSNYSQFSSNVVQTALAQKELANQMKRDLNLVLDKILKT